ncbi:MAG: hypothetical protein M3P34_05940 [Actinomycetota bacterium]|nr:hypothetical protein [Actinomycetota bacterium]
MRRRVEAIARATLAELSEWQTTLRAMANHLEDLEARSRREIAQDLHVEDL